jgi:hypothetical protein
MQYSLQFSEKPFMKVPQTAEAPLGMLHACFCWFHHFHLEFASSLLTMFHMDHRGRQTELQLAGHEDLSVAKKNNFIF